MKVRERLCLANALNSLALLVLTFAIPASASEEQDWLDSLSSAPQKTAPTEAAIVEKQKTFSEMATQGTRNGRHLRAHADWNLKNGNIDQSLKLLEKALELNKTDFDIRTDYANTLEKKVLEQNKQDPKTYNLCVKQWFYIYKTSEFLEDSTLAARHLKDLTGNQPTMLSTAKSYLPKVLMPEESPEICSEPSQVP